MPLIGGVLVPDDVTLVPRQPQRPTLGAILGSAAESAIGQLRYGLPYQAKKLIGDIRPGDEEFYTQGLARAQAAGDRAPAASVEDVTSGRVNPARFVIENLVGSLPYMAGETAGAIGGGLLGGPGGAFAGAIAAGTPQFSASNVARAVQEHGKLTEDTAQRALAVAPLQTLSDVAVERYLPGAEAIFGNWAARQTGGFIARTAKSVGKAATTEAVTEASQQLGERYAAGIPIDTPAAAAEYVNAAVTAFGVGGLLGAGGGFRRSHAVVKPPSMVTVDDLNQAIDEALGNKPPAVPEQQLGLPLQGGFAEHQPGLPLAQPAAEEPLPASKLPQLPMEPPLSAVPRETQLELGQRFTDNLTPYTLPGYRGVQVSPELEGALQGAPRPGEATIFQTPPPPAEGPATSALAIARSQVPGVEVPEIPGIRLFRDAPIDQLEALIKDKKTSPEVAADAQQEIAARGHETRGNLPLAPEKFQERLDEAKRGLRGGFVQSIEATSPAELLNKVYTEVFDNGNTQTNVQKFAQRLGILDENLEPGPEAKKLEAQRAEATTQGGGTASPAVGPEAGGVALEPPAPPQETTREGVAGSQEISPTWVSDWKGILKDAGVQRLTTKDIAETPPNLQAARAQVFRALATDTSNAAVSQTEKVGQQLGLITNDDAMDVTPLGRQVFLTTPEGIQATGAAAVQQGHAGPQAAMFDRGVQAAAGAEPQTNFTSFVDMAAYEAGRVWAQDFVQNGDVKTAAQTKAIQERVGARATATTEERPTLTPQQVQQASLNNLINLADLRNAGEADVAGLFRMVREGATSEEVGQALQQVQSGKSLFKQPAPQPFTATPQVPVPGQPAFREMSGLEQQPSKAQNRAETNNAVAVKREALRQEIDAAYKSGDITGKERIGLVARLVGNDFAGVVNHLPGGPLRREMNVSRRGFLAGVAATAVTTAVDAAHAKIAGVTETAPSKQLRAYVTSGNIPATLQHLAEHSTDPGYRAIARKLLANGGWEKVTLATTPDMLSKDLYGVTQLNDDGSSTIELYGEPGLYEETILHELLHAYVQQRWAEIGVYTEHNKQLLSDTSDRHDAAINGFVDLWDKIRAALKETNPGLILDQPWADQFYSSPDEALSWLMTNKQAQAYLQSVDETGAKTGVSLWERFKQWIANVLGIDYKSPPVRSALDELLDAGHAILDAGKDVRTGDFNTLFASELAHEAGRQEMRVSTANRTVDGANEATKSLVQMTEKVVGNINLADFGVRARRRALGWLSHNQIDRQYGTKMPALLKHSDAHRERVAVRSRFEQMGDEAYQNFEKLERENKDAAERLGKLMALTTEFQIDPDKAFEAHTHLNQNDGRLRSLHDAATKLKNDLRRGDGQGWQMFNDFRALNEAQNFARLAASLHGLVAMDPELSLGVEDSEVNPVDKFMREDVTSAQAIRDRWLDLLNKQVAAASTFITEKKGQAALGTESDQRAMANHLEPIELQIRSVYESLAAMNKAPYFHLGRFGDYFGSGVVRKTAGGVADPAALKHLGEQLEAAGFKNVQISTDNTKPNFYLRFDTVDQVRQFRDLALELQRQGWLAEDDIKAGPRSLEGNYGVSQGLPGFVQRYIQALETSPMFTPDEGMTDAERGALEGRKNDAVRLAIDTWLEQQPDSAISKVLTTRYTVPGYNPDMIRNFAHRWRVGSISLANVASQPKFNRAFLEMRAQVNEALIAKNQEDADLPADLMREMKVRDGTVPLRETADTFDKLRAFGHAYFLGFSPAYALVNLTQLGVTGLPELAKNHGYSKSFHAMRRASADAYAILKAAGAEAKALGPKHWADVAITESVLKKAGLSDEKREFARHMLATGTIDIGSAARALGQIAEGGGSKLDLGLKYASAVGLYTETYTRLVMALAARDLHGGSVEEAAKYATKAVSNSMFDYQSWNTGRQLGKQGFAGPITPLLTQFMSYSVQVTEKLYSEIMDAASRQRPGESAEAAKQRRSAARTFLFGHLTAVTALAGTLGMPFASVFATVLERMVDTFDDDDQPFDATAAWRNFLASVFGKDVAEVVARGLPRAAGFDLSQRAGEADLLPFTQLIGDRRSWREAIQGYFGRSLGASPNMLLNIADGGEQLANGDVLGGMKAILPIALKGPTEAFRMTQDGYVDTKGNKLPLSPTASSYLWQLLGFSPGAKAEYSEARGDQLMRRVALTQQSGEMRDKIVKAILTGDTDRARDLTNQAIEFDKANPSYAVVPSLAGAMQARLQARAQAQALQVPLGVSARDIAGQSLTRYANVGYGQ